MKFFRAALLLWLCIESLAFAAIIVPMKPPALASSGNWVGNGGVIAVCKDEHGTTAAPIDLVEVVPEQVIPDFAEGTLLEQVHVYIDRLAEFVPDRAVLYRFLAKNFLKQTIFQDKNLPRTTDTGTAIIPANCETYQAVIQFGTQTPENNSYFVSRKVWKDLNPRNLAVLILHEILYFEASSLGHMNNSTSVRRLVRAIVGNEFKGRTPDEFRTFLLSIKLATEVWNDPSTNLSWLLTSEALEDSPGWNIESCRRLWKGRIPTSGEFNDVATRLFASSEAKALYPDVDSLAFWVKDTGWEGLYLVDRFGARLQPDEFGYVQGPKIKFCVSEKP